MPKVPIDYSKGLIYKLVCLDTNVKDIYIGSTTNFNERKRQHKNACNNEVDKHYNYKVYQFIRNNGGFVNWSMELVEYFPTDDKLKLLKREGELIRESNATLNSKIAGRTEKEYREEYYENNKEHIAEINKEYRDNNKEHIAEIKKKYRDNNKETITLQMKGYRDNNKEHIAEINKKYRDNNKEVIQQKKKEKFTCDCGSCIRIGGKSEHIKSIKHIKYVESLGV
jgi:predicted GIY-YIG superfamily endonuclease